MNAFLFADAIRSKPVRVLRLPMLEYSIGHELLLQSERNALLLPGFDSLQINEKCFAIIRAALICSRTYEEYSKRQSWLKFWHWMICRDDFFESIKSFQEYRMRGSSYPPLPDKEAEQIANAGSNEETGRILGGELTPRLINFMASRIKPLGYDTVYNFPYGYALHLYFTDLEMEGRLKIENDRERQVRKELDDILNAIKKEKEAASPL